MARLKAALPDVPIVEQQLLTEYDSYYYSRGRQTPLPVLRVKFDDPAETWVYIDPEMSQVLAQIHRLNRVERWLYNGLHSLDFAFWYDRRPLWDIGMIALCLGGLASSGIGPGDGGQAHAPRRESDGEAVGGHTRARGAAADGEHRAMNINSQLPIGLLPQLPTPLGVGGIAVRGLGVREFLKSRCLGVSYSAPTHVSSWPRT